ncbi:MAG: hypothetical protein H7Y27_14705 [Gemmatimonadaceae bacterium]|nr:hypothetical protein [Chitinophagaceae bacterium]
MKQLLAILLFSITASAVNAQASDTLRIYLNGKLVWHNTGIQTMDVKTITIPQKKLKTAVLTFDCRPSEPRPDWRRSFQFADSEGQPAFQKDFKKASGKFVIKASEFKAALAKNKRLQLFTYTQPPEGSLLAGTIRLQRTFMCELFLQ